jgi:hypothetical protein
MTTKIEVKEYNGKTLEVTYTINQQISGSQEIIVNQNYSGGPQHNTTMDEEDFMDDIITQKGFVIGLTNKIHIFSLTPADKVLFENLDELPTCIKFTVDPGVNLSKILKINNQEYKTDVFPICHEKLFTSEHGDLVVGLGPQGCGHKFHRDCLHMALQHSDNCPVCRRRITGMEPISIDRDDEDSEGKPNGESKSIGEGKPNGGKRRKTRKGKKSRKSRKSRKGGKKGKKSRRK